MQVTRRRDTEGELRLRRALHRLGLRYLVDRRALGGSQRRADIVFPRKRVAVFYDSCYWHSCELHGTWPKENAAWWRAKLEGNRARDRTTDEELRLAGWRVIRVWQHDDIDEAATQIATAVGRAPKPVSTKKTGPDPQGARPHHDLTATPAP